MTEPRDPQIVHLEDAFARGDYRAVRDGEKAIATGEATPALRKAARAIAARTEPHPLAKYMFLLVALLLALLSFYWFAESKR
jgi:hypothetical protein